MAMIRMRYVKQYRDRTGKMRYYLRHPGSPKVPLPGLPGSEEFMAAYSAGVAESERPKVPKGRHGEGTVGALVTSFYQSSAFQNLAPSSQTRYRLVLDKFSKEDGHRLVRDMPRRVAIRMIEEIGEKKPAMANLSCKIMRRLFTYAIKKELRADNPFVGIDPYKLGSHRAWTEAEIATYESTWAIGTRERLAFDLLLYTAQRVGDVAAMRRSDLYDGVIHVTQQKTGTHVAITLHPHLLRSLKACPAKGLSLFGAQNGKPVSGKGLSQLIRRSARKAGLPKDCVAHGLRKSSMTRLANHGASTKEITAVSGHRTLKEVERYTEAVDNERLARAAIARLPREQNGT
jgi:enterobacteria phage integrase